MDALGPAFWLITLTVGVVILGLAIGYGVIRTKDRSRVERQVTEAATRREYKIEDRDTQ